MDIPADVVAQVDAIYRGNEEFVPRDDLRQGDDVLGTVPDDLKKICIAYLIITGSKVYSGRAKMRRSFWNLMGELFPEAGTKVATGKFQFGVRKNWQIVIFPFEPPSVRAH